MISIARLFHLDLTSAWDRSRAAYQPLPEGGFEKLFADPAAQLAADPRGLIAPRLLFQDEEYVGEALKAHQGGRLALALTLNRDDGQGGLELIRERRDLPLTPESVAAVKAMLPERRACGLPWLAEVEIVLEMRR